MEEEVTHKKELKLKFNSAMAAWEVVNAKGFYPEEETFTKDKLRDFLARNEDVKVNLVY